jgi:hypothetical protein
MDGRVVVPDPRESRWFWKRLLIPEYAETPWMQNTMDITIRMGIIRRVSPVIYLTSLVYPLSGLGRDFSGWKKSLPGGHKSAMDLRRHT